MRCKLDHKISKFFKPGFNVFVTFLSAIAWIDELNWSGATVVVKGELLFIRTFEISTISVFWILLSYAEVR